MNEPVDHPACFTGVGLAFGQSLAQVPLEGDGQLPGLDRAVREI